MSVGTYEGLGNTQSEKNYCPEYETSKCPRKCVIRQKLLGAENILTISEKTRIELKNFIIKNFDNKCEKGRIK